MTEHMQRFDHTIWRRGKKVLLCTHLEEDLPSYQQWINDPALNRFLLRTWPAHEAGQRAWFQRATEQSRDTISVALRTYDGTLIGNMSMNIELRTQSATTGTLIGHPDYRGRGYGTDAKMLMLDYAFNWRGLRKVTSSIIAFNGCSQRYAEKCGYRHMATIEQEHFRDGQWWDELLYVVFADEWRPLWEEYRADIPTN